MTNKSLKRRAFTLVEAVVSAALMSIVLTCTVHFFTSANDASDRVSNYVMTEVSYNSIVEEFRTVHTQEQFNSFKSKYGDTQKISFPTIQEYIATTELDSYQINANNLAILKIVKTENVANDLIVVQYLK